MKTAQLELYKELDDWFCRCPCEDCAICSICFEMGNEGKFPKKYKLFMADKKLQRSVRKRLIEDGRYDRFAPLFNCGVKFK